MATELIKDISNWTAGKIFDRLSFLADGVSTVMSEFCSVTAALNISMKKKATIRQLFQHSTLIHSLKELRTVPELWSQWDWNKTHLLTLLLQQKPDALTAYLSNIFRIWHQLHHPCRGWGVCKEYVDVSSETIVELGGLDPKRSYLDRSIMSCSIAKL